MHHGAKISQLVLFAVLAVVGFYSSTANARYFAHPTTLEALEPLERRRVLYLSSMGDPSLGFANLNFGCEIDGDWRFTIGGGYFYGASLGIGLRYRLFDSSEELRPFLGIMIAGLYTNYVGTLPIAMTARGATGPYFFSLGGAASVGLDWKFPSGLYVGAGANFWAWTHNHDTAVAPFFNIGYFFPSKTSLTFDR